HEGQRDNKYETSVEPSTQSIEPNDSYSNYEKEFESVNDKETKTYQGRFAIPLMSTYEIIADSEYSTISATELSVNNRNKSSHQLQSTLTVSGLLQMFDNDNSDDDTSYYEGNYKKPTKGKKRQKNNDNEDEDNNETAQSLRKRNGKPEALKDMTNIFEVYLSAVTVPQPKVTIAPRNLTDDKSLARLWHEEMTCLFLRCRNPPDGAIESLITEIFNYELYTELVHEFKERKLGEQISTPSRLDINEFITHKVGECLLKRYMSDTNKDKLRRCRTMDTLIKLIKEAFKIFFITYNTKAIKRLDNLTIGCRIPSKFGKNIASRISISLTNSSDSNYI
ncbi:1748_t:CDS:2, partial [Cetraspora pellucida]